MIFSHLLIVFLFPPVLFFFIFSPSFCLPSFLFLGISSQVLIRIFSDLSHGLSECPFHSLSFRLLVLLSHSFISLLRIEVMHELLTKRFIFPAFFWLISSILSILSRIVLILLGWGWTRIGVVRSSWCSYLIILFFDLRIWKNLISFINFFKPLFLSWSWIGMVFFSKVSKSLFDISGRCLFRDT